MEQSNKNLWHFPLALAAVLVLSACGKAPESAEQMPAAKVSVAEVIEQPINEWDEFTGRLEAPESVEIRPRVSGFIDQVAFDEGSLVSNASKHSCNRLAPARPARKAKPIAASAYARATPSPPNWPTLAPARRQKPRLQSPASRRNWITPASTSVSPG
jgi:hypothetical protein